MMKSIEKKDNGLKDSLDCAQDSAWNSKPSQRSTRNTKPRRSTILRQAQDRPFDWVQGMLWRRIASAPAGGEVISATNPSTALRTGCTNRHERKMICENLCHSWRKRSVVFVAMKILYVVGARPNFMKIAPIMHEMA
jgi:hypothetical protein